MRVSDVYSGNFVKAEHLRGQEVTVTIESEAVEEVGDEKKRQIVLSFVGMGKRLGLNCTNANTIAGLYGDETTSWIGKQVTLYPTTTTFGRDVVPCIRIRDAVPTGTPAPVQPPPPPVESGPVSF